MSAHPTPLPRSFWRLTLARGLSTLATNMLGIVIAWSVFHATKSSLALGLVGLAEAVPALSLAMWAGWLVDRGDALRLYRQTMWAHALLTLLPLGSLLWRDSPDRPHLLGAAYAAIVLLGAARSFLQPCLFALTPRLVERDQLPRAASYSSAVLQGARVLGPGLGGLLYSACGPLTALNVTLACFLVSLLVLAPIRLPTDRPAPAAAVAKSGQLLEGLRFVVAHPVLLPALSLDMVCVLFGGVTAVLPVFAEEILHAGPMALGALRAAPAVGAILGSLALTRLDVRRQAGPAFLASVAGFGLCMVAFALSTNVVFSCAVLLVSGLLDSVSVQVRQLIVQLMSPDDMRGRISAVNAMFIGSSNELGEFESGLMAWWFGLIPSVLGGCTVCLAFVAWMAASARSLRTLDLTKH